MSTLTKILIVVLVVLAIAHSAVLLAYLSQQRSWKAFADEQSETAKTLQARLTSVDQANSLLLENLRKEKAAFLAYRESDNSLLIQAQTDLASAQLKLGKLTANNDAFSRQLANLNNSLTRAQQARDHASAQLDRARNTANDLKAENSQLERQVAELLSDVMVLDTEVRRKKEQIAALQDDIRRASGRATTRTPVVPVKPSASVARRTINGKVIAVDLDARITTINVGSIAGVSEGTKLTIYDDDYVGDLEITRVFRDRSLGTILVSAKPVEVGDEVSTNPLR